MKKKTALLLNVLLFAGFFFFFGVYSRQAKQPSWLEPGALTGQVRQAQDLITHLSQTLPTEEIKLCFRGEELACDRGSDTWYLPVDMDQTGWEAGSFQESLKGLQVLPLEDYTILDKKTVVADGQKVPLLVWNEREASCAVIDVVFTGLPVVRIETNADLDIDTVFAGSIVFYQDCGQPVWTLTSAFEAHERGQTTRDFPKKGYRLNLITVTPTGVVRKNAQSVLGMRDADSWIFYAIYSDGTKVRDKFNIELWNEFGASIEGYPAHFGTHMEYVELIVNGEYRGLYGILEPIDSKQLEISEQEYLYKRTYGRELESQLFDEVSPEEYLSVLGMEIKGRDGAGTREDWQCFRQFTELCEKKDEDFIKEAPKLLDMANFADIWLYLQMIYGEDNIYKNMFFAFKRETEGYRLYLVPWDVDLSWGNTYVDEKQALYTVYAPERADQYLEWPLADRMLSLNVGGIRSYAADRWRMLRQDTLSDAHMEEVLRGCIHQVQDSGAFARDAKRWPDSHHDGDYEKIRTFLQKRMVFLDAYMKKIEVGWE